MSDQELKDAAMMDRHSTPQPLLSQTYQQTLRRSFCLAGTGLHSGEVEGIRVSPAFAGEVGRRRLPVSKPVLEAPMVSALETYHKPLSNFAFNFNLRRYSEGRYFVRVPAGTVPREQIGEAAGGAFSRDDVSTDEAEDLILEQLRSMMSNADEATDGTVGRCRLNL
jgi:hypothetical protein